MLIKVQFGTEKPVEYNFDKNQIIIGSGMSCDIVINNPSIKSTHLLISQVGRYFYVQDLGSSNGSYIMNNKLIPGEKYQFATYFPVQITEGISIHLSKNSLKATEHIVSAA